MVFSSMQSLVYRLVSKNNDDLWVIKVIHSHRKEDVEKTFGAFSTRFLLRDIKGGYDIYLPMYDTKLGKYLLELQYEQK